MIFLQSHAKDCQIKLLLIYFLLEFDVQEVSLLVKHRCQFKASQITTVLPSKHTCTKTFCQTWLQCRGNGIGFSIFFIFFLSYSSWLIFMKLKGETVFSLFACSFNNDHIFDQKKLIGCLVSMSFQQYSI